ncbi:MAG: zinc ABC transporter substrate-binding protein [Pseudohongiellaceae bacterium]
MPVMSNTKPAQTVPALALLFLFCIALGGSAQARAQMNIAATIPPLQFIAQAVLGEHGAATAVMDVQDSPHHFNLSPGDRLAFAEADLILWIGPTLETQLDSFLARPEQQRKALAASALPALTLRRLDSGETDPHLWLDPENARAIAAALATRLGELDAPNNAAYAQNLAAFGRTLDALQDEVVSRLRGLSQVPFLVYHDAYRYFEQRFGLSHALALVGNTEVQPGMRELLERRRQIGELGARCLLLEPEANSELVATLIGSRSAMHSETVDVLGFAVEPGPDAYRQLISGIAGQFQDCLRAGSG